MGKAAAFVCVILLGTFLIATAETVNEKESEDDDNERVSPSKATGRTYHDEHEIGKNKPVENVSPDDDNAGGIEGSKQTAGQRWRNNNNKDSAAENVSPDDVNAETEAPRRRSERIRGNTANTAENVSPDDINAERIETPRQKCERRCRNKANTTENESPDDVNAQGTETLRQKCKRRCRTIANTAGNVSPYDVNAEGTKATLQNTHNRGGNINSPAENKSSNGDHTEGRMGRLIEVDEDEKESVEEGEKEKNNSVCTSPPEIEGAITPTAEDTEYAVGATVSYSCNFGYVSRNSIHHISVCRINEITRIPEWTLPEIICIPRSCGDPGYVNNGQRIGNLFTFPNKVEYECEEGFKRRGLRARYCQAGGEWSGRLPTCEQIYCTVPPDPVNGRVTYSSLKYGTELRYECNVGFLLKKHQPRICSEDGSWSNEEPECIEARCEEPQAPEHGSVKLHGEPKVGSLATYECDPGKKLVGAGTTKCLITGQWTFDPPQCLSSCSVPFIENGEMGKIETKNTRRDTHEVFQKVYFGEQVNSRETLFLRCKKGFLPLDDSEFLNSNRLEVTCNDGEWSKVLPCEKTSCTGEPPAIKNGRAEIGSRVHGYGIWYSCKNKNYVKVTGNVTCQFGKWIGIPPKCLNYACNTKDLQEIRNSPNRQKYPGLIIPPQEYFETQEGFEIHCENGFRKAAFVRKINCNRGRWDISENPCIDERGDRTTSTAKPETISPGSEVSHVVNVELPDNENLYLDHNRGCFCTYDYENYDIKAQIGHKILKRGDKVMRGETVSLECIPDTMRLTWQNGFRYFGKVNMTCSTCESWKRKDLPTCTNALRSDTFIGLENDFKILPGGIIDLYKGENRQFFCTSTYDQPIWIHGRRWGVEVTSGQGNAYGNVLFMKILRISHLSDDHSGKYECCIRQTFGECTGSSFLELQVNEVTCPWFPNRIGLSISYTNENKFGSWAEFRCASNAELVGSRYAGCQYNGIWSETQPYCKNFVTCSRFPDSPGLNVTYSTDVSVGSTAKFSCSPPSRNLIGSSISVCRENGSWSNSLPSCEDKEHTTISTTPPGSSTLTSAEECFCTYDYENPFVKAQIGHRKLKRGDNIMRGETVSFECKFVSRVLLSWQNGLRFFGKANMTCNTCQNWQSKHLPTCDYTMPADAVIGYEEDLKILPGGIVDIRRGESRQFFCSSNWSQPQWDYGEKKDVSVNITQVSGQGNIVFVSLLNIMRTQEGHSGKYECYMRGDHSQRIGSSFLDVQVDDYISCSRFPYSPGLNIMYSRNVSVGSTATFTCSPSSRNLIGSSISVCRENGSWSNPLPSCEASDITCPLIDRLGIFSIYYDNQRRVNSTARFMCKESGKKVIGCSVLKCLQNGTWSGSYPTCVDYISCSRFPDSLGLNVMYSSNVSVGSTATFTCSLSSRNLIGSSISVCRENGSWSNPLPSCEETKCSVHDLSMSVPEDIVPDLTGVNDEFITPGSVVELKCNHNSIIDGNSKALCGEHGNWEFGSIQCVPGCTLNIDPSSHLLVNPIKDSYHLGEFLILSCPPGKKLSNDVERLMCLNNKWSDSIPDCQESE